MGEMADMLLEWGGGDDEFDGGFTEEDGSWHSYNCRSTFNCKYCHTIGLQWKQFPNGQWRLVDKLGFTHKCDKYKSKKKKI